MRMPMEVNKDEQMTLGDVSVLFTVATFWEKLAAMFEGRLRIFVTLIQFSSKVWEAGRDSQCALKRQRRHDWSPALEHMGI